MSSRRGRWRAVALVAGLVITCLALLVPYLRGRNVGPVERGFRHAVSHGCIRCHGAGGPTPELDPDRELGGAPSFGRDDVQTYARSEGELREWILDGMPRRVREELGTQPPPLLRMPAFRGILGEREVDTLVAWIRAVSEWELPPPGLAADGYRLAAAVGCFTCHGPQGRGNPPNPKSLMGYIPSWDGADFPELVRDEDELREWIREGSPHRLRRHPIARLFLERQTIRMPAYGSRLTETEVSALVAYIAWLRREPGQDDPAPVTPASGSGDL